MRSTKTKVILNTLVCRSYCIHCDVPFFSELTRLELINGHYWYGSSLVRSLKKSIAKMVNDVVHFLHY